MSAAQRRVLAGTTPTTEVIKDAVTFPRERLGEPLDIAPERFEAWLSRVRRDAAREALDRLRQDELAMIPPDADADHPIRVQKQALAWRINTLIHSDYPEEER